MKYFNETYIKRKFITRNEWADTYKAIHAATEHRVILKVLVKKSEDEEYINNLLKEVEIVKNIKNPNLIHVNNMFQYSGCGKTYYYIEGEFFKGISLEEKLVNGKFEEKEAVKIVEKIAQGLKEFHNRNLLFNNLNLSNIFINSKDVVKVDILSHLENKDFLALSQENIGEKKFNPEKNIYDLGVILYSLLTGKSIFESNNYNKQISDKNLVTIIEKATDSNLENKYVNINRFIIDIKSYLQCGELSDESYDVEEVSTNKKKRKKGKVGKTLGVCVAIALVGGAAVYGYDLLEKNKKNTETNTTKIEESIKPNQEDKKVEENKSEEEKATNSEAKEEKITETKSSTSESKKNNNSSSNSNKNNNSSSSSNNASDSNSSSNSNSNNASDNNSSDNSNNNSSNNTSKPDNSENSGNTTTKPNEGNNNEIEVPDVTPPSNNNTAGSENTTPEVSDTEVESQ